MRSCASGKKVKDKYLTSNNIILKTYMGIKTDVIEIGKVDFSQGNIKVRPLEGGCNIATSLNQPNAYGTLSCIVTKKKLFKKLEYFILSNNHVIANGNETPIGTEILQPNKDSELEWQDRVVAYLTTFIPLIEYNGYNKNLKENINYVDCALAKVVNNKLVSNRILDFGKIKGVSKAILGLDVKINGGTSGSSIGKIKTLDATLLIEKSQILKDKSWLFKEQIIADIHIFPGDSGSLVLN